MASSKLDTHVPFSSTHRVLDVVKRQMCAEASGAFVGPMDPIQFLRHFVPPPPLKQRNEKKEEKLEALLKSMADTSDEESMYPIYIAVCEQLDPDNIMVYKDSHATADPHAVPPGAPSRKGLRPDVMVYHSKRDPTYTTDFSRAERADEFKWSASEDPFNDEPNSSDYPFEADTECGKDTRGQIIAYASANLELQFRTFVFSVLILGRYARLIRWDRSGAIVTKRIDYVEDPKPLIEFLWRYNLLSDAQRGHDESVKPANVDAPDYGTAKSRLRQTVGDLDTAKSIEVFLLKMIPLDEDDHFLAASDGRPHLPSGGPSPSLSGGQPPRPLPLWLAAKSYYTTNLEPDEDTRGWDYYILAPRMSDRGPFGRVTRSLYVYDRRQYRVLHLKDTNRILSTRHAVEHEVINELGNKGVQHISTVHTAWDVAPNGRCYDTVTPAFYDSEYFDPRFAPRTAMAQRGRRPYRAYRLITNEIGTVLWRFKDWREVVQAIMDILEALDGAEAAGWRHRDLSVGNIMVQNGRGLLIDWDASQKSAEMNCMDDGRLPDQTGTWQFMSASRLLDPNHARHDAEDDIESTFWVLLWMALNYSHHSIHPDDLREYLQDVFDKASYHREGYYKGGKPKKALLREAFDKSFPNRFSPPSLHYVLKVVHRVVAIRYTTPEAPDLELLDEEEVESTQKSYEEELKKWEVQRASFTNAGHLRRVLEKALKEKAWPSCGPVVHDISFPRDEGSESKKRPNSRTSHILAQEIAKYPPRYHPLTAQLGSANPAKKRRVGEPSKLAASPPCRSVPEKDEDGGEDEDRVLAILGVGEHEDGPPETPVAQGRDGNDGSGLEYRDT
ncbi:hypothetical protein DENSPDRAFT_794640 [Dentipellis sp. KUC8613]|nr:hypothetical protein DENSPDRAFT_794640 [Dentipellis sp. KUC8613]